MKIVCFGDSNTYGYDPRGYLGGRYREDCRWVDILARNTGWIVVNQGMNGREIPRQAPAFPEDTGILIVMLGTNDLLQGRSPELVAADMERFLSEVSVPVDKLLLIAPPPMVRGMWVPDDDLVKASTVLSELYRALASRIGAKFANAGSWNVTMAYDGIHFTEEGHRTFAAHILEVLKENCG